MIVFLCPFADALDGDPQQMSGEESVVRLLSWAQPLKASTVRVTSGMGVMYINQGLIPRAHTGPQYLVNHARDGLRCIARTVPENDRRSTR